MSEMIDLSRSMQVSQNKTKLDRAVEDYSLEKEKTTHIDLLAIKSMNHQAGPSKINRAPNKKNAEITEIPNFQNHSKHGPNFGVQIASTNSSILSLESFAKPSQANAPHNLKGEEKTMVNTNRGEYQFENNSFADIVREELDQIPEV